MIVKHMNIIWEAFQQRMSPNAVGSGGAGGPAAPQMKRTSAKPGMQGVAAPGTNKPMQNPTVQAQATPTTQPPKAGEPITKQPMRTPQPGGQLKMAGTPPIGKQIKPRRQNANVNAPPSSPKPMG